MANPITKFKRSSVATKVPLTTDLALGEIAINTYDGKLYIKKNDGSDAIVEVGEASGGINNLVEDTTPQLGGNLDVQANAINTSTTNGDINLTPNGTGKVNANADLSITGDIYSGSGLVVSFGMAGTPVNNIKVTPAPTTGAPSIVSDGADTNVDLQFSAKGTGKIDLQSDVDINGDVTITGVGDLSIAQNLALGNSITDNNGDTKLKFTNNAGSNVNYVEINQAQTGFSPSITGAGTDTNVGLSIQPQGTGTVDITNAKLISTLDHNNQTISGNGKDVLSFSSNASADYSLQINNSTGTAGVNAPYITTAGAGSADIMIRPASITDALYVDGNLKLHGSGNIQDSSGFNIIGLNSVGSPVNNIEVKNASTTFNPGITAVGTDTDITIDIEPKGAGGTNILSGVLTLSSGTAIESAGTIIQMLDSVKITGDSTKGNSVLILNPYDNTKGTQILFRDNPGTGSDKACAIDYQHGASEFIIRTDAGNKDIWLQCNGTGIIKAKSDLGMADNLVIRPELQDYSITHTTPTITSGAITFDCEVGNSFNVSLTENITAITLSNPPATGKYGEIFIEFLQDATGSRTVAWPASVKWPGGTAPVITTTATTGKDTVRLTTRDAGTTWLGTFDQDFS